MQFVKKNLQLNESKHFNLISLHESIFIFIFSLYNRLLNEQAQRFQLEKNVQSYENLNVNQLKERLIRVENSNNELQQLVHQLLSQKPTYKNTLFIPRVSK